MTAPKKQVELNKNHPIGPREGSSLTLAHMHYGDAI